jgi:pyruvate-formate lyase-activating enzyme
MPAAAFAMRPTGVPAQQSQSYAIGPAGPSVAVWDVAGRRSGDSGRQLRFEDHVRIAEAIVKLGPGLVTFAGDEPLAVPHLTEIATRIRRAGIEVGLIIGTGRRLDEHTADAVCRVFDHVTVCFGGATADVHDAVRGNVASFAQTLRSAATIDRAAAGHEVRITVDYEVAGRNFGQLHQFCTRVVPRFANLDTIAFNALVPGSPGDRPGRPRPQVADLLDDEQFAELGNALAYRLQALVPPGVTVTVSDNRELRMDPEGRERFQDFRPLLVEPNGAVRAMPLYFGTLSRVRTVRDWVDATTALDYRFGAADPDWPATR